MSGDETSWRSELPFSARIANIATMQVFLNFHGDICRIRLWRPCSQSDQSSVTAYQSAHPEIPSNEAKNYGKIEEQRLRSQAKSLTEYRQLLVGVTTSLQSAAEPQREAEHIFPNLPEHGATIGPFKNAHHYRDGITSEVFIAKDEGKMLALKITTPHMLVPPHDAAREVRVLQSLKDVPNIIELLETFTDNHSRLVLVFPYQPYELSTLLIQDELPKTARKSVIRDMFTGLAYLHRTGIIHRDVKPSNILLSSPSGPAYLADFGIAWSLTDKASEPADEKILDVGTTCYRPPELLFGGQTYGTALDLWAAGCVVAQIVSLGRETLFDAGELGSELALIKSIFQTMGTADTEIWPEAAALPDWGKMNFVKYPGREWEEILPQCDDTARELVASLVVYESSLRVTADGVLQHPYLQDRT